MATGFHGARVRHIVEFLIQNTSNGIMYLIHSLEACYGDVWLCLDIKKYQWSCFRITMGKGVKRFTLAVKISANYPRALIGIASGLYWASPSLSRSSSIFKRLGFYTLASNCIKPVRTIHLTMSTYTFNYCYPMGDNIDGEIRKKNVTD